VGGKGGEITVALAGRRVYLTRFFDAKIEVLW
jgi:hypothetical protein